MYILYHLILLSLAYMYRNFRITFGSDLESFNSNISNQLFDYTISIHSTRTQIQKVILYSKIGFKR